MTLNVTPGDSSADSFVSVDDCDAYCTARGLTGWTGHASSPPEDKEAALRRSTAALGLGYTWKGTKTNGRDQALAWPRDGVVDDEGLALANDTIPTEIAQACCEIAAREIVTPGFMTPDVVLTDRVLREKVGPLETDYAPMPITADANRPRLPMVDGLVAGLITTGTNALVGASVRR